MHTTKNIDDVCARMRELAPGAIVGLEGFSGSGKTKFAHQLSLRLSVNVQHVDSFATAFDNPPRYLDCLDLVKLRRALEEGEQSRPLIVEGICLRDVLSRIGMSATTYVYVKRIGKNGLWYDGLHLEDFEAGNPIPGDTAEPHHSDLEYHARIRPHELADLTYERVADD